MLQGYADLIFNGAKLTITLALCSLLLAVALGLIVASCKLSHARALKFLGELYTSLIRGVPDLVLMLLIFYGLQFSLNDLTDYFGLETIQIEPLTTGVLTLGFIYGAYFAETFRGGYLAVPNGLISAATALGFSGWQTFRYVRFPLMMRFALPGLANNWLVLLKATALVSLLGLSDLLKATRDAGEASFQPLYFALIAAGFYLLLTTLSNLILWWLNRHFTIGVKQATL